MEEIKEKIRKIEEKQKKEREKYSIKYTEAREREKEAQAAAEKAYKKTDIESYHKALEEARINADAMKIYGSKVTEIDSKPWIDEEEFKGLYKEICDYLAGIVEEDREILAELCAKMVEIKKREHEEITEGNKLIEHIQRDLLMDPCGIMSATGNFIEQPYKVKRFKDLSVLEYINFVTAHPFVKDLIEIEPQGAPKVWGKV